MIAEFNNISISKIGTAVPKNSLDLMSLTNLGSEQELKTIIKTTGISSVRVAEVNVTSSDLCIEAANNILGNSENEEIDALIFVSQTRDYHLPQTSFIIQSRMNLRKDIFCLDIPLGCSGYINGLFQASLLLQIPNIKKVLLLAGDTSTKMINYKDRATRMVFGDGGSATVLEKGNDTISFNIQSDGSGADSLIIKSGIGFVCLLKKLNFLWMRSIKKQMSLRLLSLIKVILNLLRSKQLKLVIIVNYFYNLNGVNKKK